MKTLLLLAGIGISLAGCASSTVPQIAWGKPGVSKVEYGSDVGACSGLAALQKAGNGSNTAGGIDGRAIENTVSPAANSSPTPGVDASGNQTSHVDAPLPASGTYSGMASADFAQRAAMQQRTAEMAVQRARAEALKSCLVGRGYQEFALTAEQRAQLATLEKGSNQYHEYLYKVGSSRASER